LLRQPHGFEGFRFLMAEVELDSGHEPIIVVGPNPPALGIDLDPATRSFDVAAYPNQNLVSDDAKIQRFDHLGLEGVWFHPSANPRSTFERLSLIRDQLDLRMDVLPEGIEIAAIEGVECPPQPRDDLRIWVTHRPRSIPQVQESA
jgi:hypothetical protein